MDSQASSSNLREGRDIAHSTEDQSRCRGRAQEFVELHDQVQSSVNLLDSLELFLSTFQKDLSAVSGHISNLQDRSKDIDNRLKTRRKIERPLSNLLLDLCIPPSLTTLILDTDVGEPWIAVIPEFEQKLDALKTRVRVKAARDMAEVAEGLRIVAATKLRAFFLALLQPIRTSMTTNLQVAQSSIFLKYRPLFTFLQRHALAVANEVQRAYVGAARTFYETGFRRYIRSLGWLKARSPEKAVTIVTESGDTAHDGSINVERLSYAHIAGSGVALAYQVEENNYKEPLEAILRSLLLVLMDNATAEYAFITSFFAVEHRPSVHTKDSNGSTRSPSLLSPTQGEFDETRSNLGSEIGSAFRQRVSSISSVMSAGGPEISFKEEQAALNATWKQIMDPVLAYCQTFVDGVLDPAPPVIPLLTMIRLTEEVIAETQKRHCGPLENFVFGIRLQMWPVFQKLMAENIDATKKYAEGAVAGYFRRGVTTTDEAVANVCQRYIELFNSFIALTSQPEETMIFSNLLRLRQEVAKLITTHTEKINEAAKRATTQSLLCETLLQGLSKGPSPSHPKAQSEIAFWREREEEARRRIISTNRQR